MSKYWVSKLLVCLEHNISKFLKVVFDPASGATPFVKTHFYEKKIISKSINFFAQECIFVCLSSRKRFFILRTFRRNFFFAICKKKNRKTSFEIKCTLLLLPVCKSLNLTQKEEVREELLTLVR